jgi:hypothetical protein
MVPAMNASLGAWAALNRVLEEKIGPDAMLGHSYLYALQSAVDSIDDESTAELVISQFWRCDLLPQLVESLRTTHSLDQFVYKQDGIVTTAIVLRKWFGADAVVLKGEGLQQRAMINQNLKAPNKMNNATDDANTLN